MELGDTVKDLKDNRGGDFYYILSLLSCIWCKCRVKSRKMTLDHYKHTQVLMLITAIWYLFQRKSSQTLTPNMQLLIQQMFSFTSHLQKQSSWFAFLLRNKSPLSLSYLSITHILLFFLIIWSGALDLNWGQFFVSRDIFDYYD